MTWTDRFPTDSGAGSKSRSPVSGFGACLPPYIVSDDQMSPHLRPGDRLVCVTCVERLPRFGEFVLVRPEDEARYRVMRYISPARGPSPRTRSILLWSGAEHRRLPVTALRGRVLSVVRDEVTSDLRVPRGWPGRDILAAAIHRVLRFLSRHLPPSPGPAGRAAR
ncbi:MAG: S24/S26 family peptidase [Acidobacteriota bacterium]